MYRELLPIAKKNKVKIALENMWNWDSSSNYALPASCSNPTDFLAHLNLLNDPSFVACLDIGHAEMKGVDTSAEEMILALNKNLKCLHIHDNDKRFDEHALPFTRNIDFEPIIDALARINYTGDITFETDNFPSKFPQPLYLDALKLLSSIGRYFKTEIEKRKVK